MKIYEKPIMELVQFDEAYIATDIIDSSTQEPGEAEQGEGNI